MRAASRAPLVSVLVLLLLLVEAASLQQQQHQQQRDPAQQAHDERDDVASARQLLANYNEEIRNGSFALASHDVVRQISVALDIVSTHVQAEKSALLTRLYDVQVERSKVEEKSTSVAEERQELHTAARSGDEACGANTEMLRRLRHDVIYTNVTLKELRAEVNILQSLVNTVRDSNQVLRDEMSHPGFSNVILEMLIEPWAPRNLLRSSIFSRVSERAAHEVRDLHSKGAELRHSMSPFVQALVAMCMYSILALFCSLVIAVFWYLRSSWQLSRLIFVFDCLLTGFWSGLFILRVLSGGGDVLHSLQSHSDSIFFLSQLFSVLSYGMFMLLMMIEVIMRFSVSALLDLVVCGWLGLQYYVSVSVPVLAQSVVAEQSWSLYLQSWLGFTCLVMLKLPTHARFLAQYVWGPRTNDALRGWFGRVPDLHTGAKQHPKLMSPRLPRNTSLRESPYPVSPRASNGKMSRMSSFSALTRSLVGIPQRFDSSPSSLANDASTSHREVELLEEGRQVAPRLPPPPVPPTKEELHTESRAVSVSDRDAMQDASKGHLLSPQGRVTYQPTNLFFGTMESAKRFVPHRATGGSPPD
ncbi:hypothetical protein FVE85_5189 [Porphyridium purpureum]|uniref:Uncharacterized protein n=1 Tax=Porphyridium purpureum TaxID=35688 RepID=A0A5J4Z3U9_PORPP|nr:hypothetical protein FVE85_5189 [Porphyridium purpureum]|eukprot:POR0252..scf295_1